jgi:hypothetical protein
MRARGLPLSYQATGPAIGLCIALAFASVTKARLLHQELGAPVSGWRWDLLWPAAAGIIVGAAVKYLFSGFLELIIGVPAIMLAFGAVLWTTGFGPEDRELFKLRKSEVQGLRDAEAAAEARDQVEDDII